MFFGRLFVLVLFVVYTSTLQTSALKKSLYYIVLISKIYLVCLFDSRILEIKFYKVLSNSFFVIVRNAYLLVQCGDVFLAKRKYYTKTESICFLCNYPSKNCHKFPMVTVPLTIGNCR